MSLNVRASRCCSALPSTFARADRSPSATRRAAWSSRRTGPATWPAITRAEPEPEHEHERPDRDQPERGAPGRAVDRFDALRHAHGAHDLAGAGAADRHGRREDRPSERLAVALLLLGVVGERLLDLRARAVVEAEPLVAVRVRDQPAVRADHDHTAAHLLGGARGHLLEALTRAQLVLERHRDELGLAHRLRLHFGVDAVADADDERDLERDDREHQHVGERQQESEAEAYESSSGAVNRKPTPRTVCR